MPVVEEKVDGHMKTVTYQESPIMSTYLVAIVVGLFDYIEDHTSDGKIIDNLLLCVYLVQPQPFLDGATFYLVVGVIVRVYCQVGRADQGKFALDLAVRTLEFYKEYVY